MSQKASLPNTIVGIDVETTSLEPATGDIIEIAAIRYDLTKPKTLALGTESAEFIRFAKPRQPLSAEITAITGITQSMVMGAPPFSEFIKSLESFIGDSLVFAHNASFDIDFLDYHGLNLKENFVWDTFALASVAWPTSPSYNLGTLADQLNITARGEHRAGDDVRMTWQLLNKIYQQLQISKETYQQIAELLKKSNQEHYLGLFRTLSQKKAGAAGDPTTPQGATRGTVSEPNNFVAVGPESVGEIFSSSGPLAKSLPNYAPRPEQLAMAKQVAKLVKNKEIGFIETGPGTGKTYAYLAPLLLQMAKDRATVSSNAKKGSGGIISTHTKTLQDQLLHDTPQLLASLKLPYQVAILKGRRNYLCLTRLLKALQRAILSPADAWLLTKLLVWLDQGADGDLEQLNVSYQAQHILRHIHADSISCRTTCTHQSQILSSVASAKDECPYRRALERALYADIVIINHALLMQLAGDDSILPLNYLVIDEAHHLEEAARQSSRVDLSEHRVEEITSSISQLTKAYPPQLKKRLSKEAKQLMDTYQQFLLAAADFFTRHTSTEHLRLTKALRRNSSWQKVSQVGSTWRSQLQFLNGLVASGQQHIKDRDLLASTTREAEAFNLELDIFLTGSTERIQWISRSEEESTVTLCDEALLVDQLLGPIFTSADSVILTSATLTITSNFGYIKNQLGLPSAHELILHSSFSYRDQMLIYVVDDAVSPLAPDFDSFTAHQIEKLAKLLSGRVLGLFTSHKSVRSVYAKTVKELNKANIKLLAQKITGGRHNIMERFKKIPASVLLGTYSFWEGIDTPGDTLSCVVIPKLPFPLPHNPVHEAAAEALSVNAFDSFSLPQMIIKLRQGIGRLIRSASDSGSIIILDSRFLNQNYGDQVLNSLPPATIHIGPQKDLIPTLKKWYGNSTIDQWSKELK